jgi:hypothetical protein
MKEQVSKLLNIEMGLYTPITALETEGKEDSQSK